MPTTASDRRSFIGRFNTKLTPEQEAAFSQWMWDASQKLSRSLWNDLYDYDLRGFFASGGAVGGGHLPDTFKKPNHPTFSSDSKYHGVEGYTGGEWKKTQAGKWLFVPGPANMSVHGANGLQSYFLTREPDALLVL